MNKISFEIKQLIKNRRIWIHLGWLDLKQRYRGSILGPWWITLSMGIFISALAIVYSKLLNQPIREYLPFLTSGYLIWQFVSSTLIESPLILITSRNYILQINIGYLNYIFRLIWRNILIFSHNFIIYIFVAIYFSIPVNLYTLLFIPGFLLTIINAIWISLLLGMLGARYRDIPQLVNSTIQVIFFISPITWSPKLLHPHSFILKLNPITYFLDITRSPLIGALPELGSWLFAIKFTLIGGIIALLILNQHRKNIAFWV